MAKLNKKCTSSKSVDYLREKLASEVVGASFKDSAKYTGLALTTGRNDGELSRRQRTEEEFTQDESADTRPKTQVTVDIRHTLSDLTPASVEFKANNNINDSQDTCPHPSSQTSLTYPNCGNKISLQLSIM